jgi:hypothetical protein
MKKVFKKKVDLVSKYQQVFNTKEGKDILFDLMEKHHVFSPSYTGDKYDAIFREGERNVINYIITQLSYDRRQLLSEYQKYSKETKGAN